jgi:hypothetical protein
MRIIPIFTIDTVTERMAAPPHHPAASAVVSCLFGGLLPRTDDLRRGMTYVAAQRSDTTIYGCS